MRLMSMRAVVGLSVVLFVCITVNAHQMSDNEARFFVSNSTTTTATTTTIPTASIIKAATTIPPDSSKCGNTQKMVDECFKDLPAPLMEFLQTTRIAISKEEINAKCNIFNRGMKCFDDYTARCLTNKKQGIFKNNVEGARRFFKKFCGDANFQRDYLLHKDCFSYIQDDWVRCTKDFQNILSDELQAEKKNATDKFMEFCCARYAYENCIYNAARYKCYKHSAKFARDTAQMLSDEKHFSNCRQYEDALCVAGYSTWRSSCWHYLLLLLMLMREIVRQRACTAT